MQRGQPSATEPEFPGSMPCPTLHITTRGSALFINDRMELTVARSIPG